MRESGYAGVNKVPWKSGIGAVESMVTGTYTSRIFFPGGESLFCGVPFPYPAPSRAGLRSTDKFAVSSRILN